MTLLGNLDFYYEEAPLEVKRKLIGSIFTEKLVFVNGNYRTTKMNPAVELIGQFQRESGNKKDGRFSFEGKMSDHVPTTGPFSNQFFEGMSKIFDLREFLQRENLLDCSMEREITLFG
jgi:site-specific DNA recombinase